MRCRWNHLLGTLLLLAATVLIFPAQGQQPVVVTARLDTNVVNAGESTTLRVFAEIHPSFKDSTDRIFSWYVDLLHTNNTVANANYNLLARPESDNDPVLSSPGFTDGTHRRAIYDTFLNLPDAGRLQPVELFSVPVTGSADGQTTFRVQAGTEGPGLSSDFLVAPEGGGDPLTGADYSMAVATLTVGTVIEPPEAVLSIERTATPGQLLLTYPIQTGEDHWIEYRDSLGAGSWQTLSGGPYNEGQLLVTASQSARFYRLRIGGVIAPPSPSISIERTDSPNELLLT